MTTTNTNEPREGGERENKKLAKILFGMCEGPGEDRDTNIYADGFQTGDGDIYVYRAAEILVEQDAEIDMLLSTINLLSDDLAKVRASQQAGAAGASAADRTIAAAARQLANKYHNGGIGSSLEIARFWEFVDAIDKATPAQADTGIKSAARLVGNWEPDKSWVQHYFEAQANSGMLGASQSIDTPEFQGLIGKLIEAQEEGVEAGTSLPFETALAKLVAHIDAQLALHRNDAEPVAMWGHKLKDGSGYGNLIFGSEEAAERHRKDNQAGRRYVTVGFVEATPAAQAAQQSSLSDDELAQAVQVGFTTPGVSFPAADRAEPLARVSDKTAAPAAQADDVLDSHVNYTANVLHGQAAQADDVRDALEQALRDIADPIGAMKREVPEGYSLNGHAAVQMANDPQWYKNRAQQALDALRATPTEGKE